VSTRSTVLPFLEPFASSVSANCAKNGAPAAISRLG
jgi:hypothetical protein